MVFPHHLDASKQAPLCLLHCLDCVLPPLYIALKIKRNYGHRQCIPPKKNTFPVQLQMYVYGYDFKWKNEINNNNNKPSLEILSNCLCFVPEKYTNSLHHCVFALCWLHIKTVSLFSSHHVSAEYDNMGALHTTVSGAPQTHSHTHHRLN